MIYTLSIQSDPAREGEPHVQREPRHRLRPDADESPRAGRHDGAQRHPIPETRGGNAHHQRRCVVLRGGERKIVPQNEERKDREVGKVLLCFALLGKHGRKSDFLQENEEETR